MRATSTITLAGVAVALSASRASGDTWMLGVNEAISVPAAHGIGAEADALLDAQAEKLTATGARYVRLNASSTPRLFRVLRQEVPDWTEVDKAMRRLGALDVAVVVVVAPWPANEPWTMVASCAIETPEAWQRRVQHLVERYDGDGKDDAPGAARVVAWEVDNEPDLHEDMRPGFCPPELHAETVRVTAEAIKRADPSATVLNGGLYRPHSALGKAYLASAVAAGLADHIDGFAGHVYPSAGNESLAVERLVRNVREVLGEMPIWITETSSIGEGDGTGPAGEAEQARAFAEVVGTARRLGVHALFWHTLTDPPIMRPGGVPYPGLFAVEVKEKEDGKVSVGGWREKPAVEVFRRMRTAGQGSGSSGGVSWSRVAGGWMVWSDSKKPGCGRPPAVPHGIAGGKVEADPCGWQIDGAAFAADQK